MTTNAKPQHINVNHPDFIQSIQHRDVWHWTQLHERMQGRLDAFFRHTSPSCHTDDIENDIIEVFSRAYADIHLYQGQSSLTTWIMHLARRVAHDPFRAVENKNEAPPMGALMA